MTDHIAKARLVELATDEGPHIERVMVPKILLRRLLALVEQAKPCPHCQLIEPFDVVAHESVPSRLKPFAAAAALNLTKAGA